MLLLGHYPVQSTRAEFYFIFDHLEKERWDILENEMLACVTVLGFQNTQRAFGEENIHKK